MRPPKPNSVEPPWYGPVCPVVWEGWRREASPYPDQSPLRVTLTDLRYYSTLIETRRDIVEKNPDLVQRFVDASAIGWYHYLYGDNSKANAMIKDENPDITDDQIAFSIGEMKKYGVVDSGDTFKLGIGAMTDARWKDFFDKMVETGMVAARVDYKKAYTLQFVDKGVGLNLRPQ